MTHFKKSMFVFLSLMLLIPISAAFGQIANPKHPRVAELESVLNQDIANHVKARFPNLPFLVKVDIDPLRRLGAEISNERDNLPFMGSSEFDINDEWDDPGKTNNELFLRVKAAAVTITLPNTVSDLDLIELRESLFPAMHFIPGRDKIDILRKEWNTGVPAVRNWWIDYAIVGFMGLFGLIVLFFMLRNVAKLLAKASEKKEAVTVATVSGGGGGSISSNSKQSSAGLAGKMVTSIDGDIRFNDPLRLKQHIKAVVDILSSDPTFPAMEDMFYLDEKARENPSMLGAALGELPMSLQKKIFGYSFHSSWLAALNDPGILSLGAFDFLGRLARNRVPAEHPAWEGLLILVWRLDDAMPEFLRTLPQDDALAILATMPSKVSLSAGKKAFPGNWGVLLNPKLRTVKPLRKVDEYKKKALAVKPLNDPAMLESYRHEKGILDYLRLTNPTEEQEIYEASGKDTIIHKVRPPFYPIFTQNEDILKRLVPQFSIDDWALALFNVNRSHRRTVETIFSEKQRYLLIESLKRLDREPPDIADVGAIRESVAKVLDTYQKEHAIKNYDPIADVNTETAKVLDGINTDTDLNLDLKSESEGDSNGNAA